MNRTTACSGNTPANPRQRTSYMTRPGDPPSPDDPLLQLTEDAVPKVIQKA